MAGGKSSKGWTQDLKKVQLVEEWAVLPFRPSLKKNKKNSQKSPHPLQSWVLYVYVWPSDVLVVKLGGTERQSEPGRPLIPILSFVCV